MEKVPILGDRDKARVEDLTGRIPLLLRALLDFAKRPFKDIEEEIWQHKDLAAVGRHVRQFASAKLKDGAMNYEQ